MKTYEVFNYIQHYASLNKYPKVGYKEKPINNILYEKIRNPVMKTYDDYEELIESPPFTFLSQTYNVATPNFKDVHESDMEKQYRENL